MTSKEIMLLKDDISFIQNCKSITDTLGSIAQDQQVKAICTQISMDLQTDATTLARHIMSASGG